ncbi:IclR family transcriptional regulator [Xenophilus azovorans]|uniref:IclR family transcriptional regulator n=1 Tax=Xenophilus TaxID=151754 RepID=UPI0005707D47|nr:IclR family transcriptional regulator [Xenophilus azovorans]
MEKTVIKAFNTLELLATSSEPQGVTALSQALGLGKSNVHRMLATLVAAGYVRATGGGRYEATLRMWEYGTHVLMRNDVKRVAGPLLQRLVKATGETAHLSVLDGREVVYVDKIDGDHPVRAYSRIGARAPAHAVATGKALLAGQSASFIESYAAELPPEGFTGKTIVTPVAFIKAMEEIREKGVAYNTGEWREGVCGVASPIRDSSGTVVAALGISGPAERLKPAALRKYSTVVIEAAAQASRALGFLQHAASR